jgi:hypothetical protein
VRTGGEAVSVELGSLIGVVTVAIVAAVVAKALDRTGEGVVDALVGAAKRVVGARETPPSDVEAGSVTQSASGNGNVQISDVEDSRVEVNQGSPGKPG